MGGRTWLRKTLGIPKRGTPDSREQPSGRSEYKKHWNSLSQTESSAKMVVSGYVDEHLYEETAIATMGLLKDTVGVRREDTILEIGAGVGRVGAVLAPNCHKWIGTDVSDHMVGHIKRRLAKFSNVTALAISGFDLKPIESSSIDLVYCTVVFMHLEEWDRYNYITEGFRVLKPGGRMFVDNVNLLSDEGWNFFETHRAVSPADRQPHISKTSTPQELEAYFQRAGFSRIEQKSFDLWVATWGVKPQ